MGSKDKAAASAPADKDQDANKPAAEASRSYAMTTTAVAVAVLAAAAGGVYNTSSRNSVFPIVIDLVQSLRESLLGAPTDESTFRYGEDGLPLCVGCHCTPSWDKDPDTFVCPTGDIPPWNYSLPVIEALESQEAKNPFALRCDPYNDDGCDAEPSLEKGSWGDDAVCGLIYDEPSSDDAEGSGASCPLSTYTIRTFETPVEATNVRGTIVTHTGPCGACSTTKDLAAYMRHPDMVSAGRRCTNRAMLSHEWGVSCYEDLGFTEPCATIWARNSLNTATVCRTTCVRHLFSAPNEPEPHCRLNECLHCDEVRSGPNFQLFAGRTRRNSGLRTPILRQCEGLATMVHDGCPMDIFEAVPAEPSSPEDGGDSEEEDVTTLGRNSIPLVGIGVGNLDHDRIPEVVAHALHSDSGYRLIDTAAASRNERMLADAIEKNLDEGTNSQIHIVTKVWYTHLGYERTKLAVKTSLSNLLLSPSAGDIRVHILLHWPRCDENISWMDCEGEENGLPQEVKDAGPPPHLDKENAWKGSWKALEDLYSPKGGEDETPLKIESIGVSNFDHEDLGALLDECRIKPHLYQGNVWALVHDPFLMKLVRDNGITFQAYNVMHGVVQRGDVSPNAYRLLEDIGRDLSKEATDSDTNSDGRKFQPFPVSKVVLAWLVQQDVSVIPRASSLLHQDDNSPRSLTEVPTLTQQQNIDVEKAVSSLLTGQDLEERNDAPVREEEEQEKTVSVTFLNSLTQQGDISIFWQSPDTGEEVAAHDGPVKVGDTATISTHPGHVFVVYDEEKNGRREFQVEADYGERQDFAVTEL